MAARGSRQIARGDSRHMNGPGVHAARDASRASRSRGILSSPLGFCSAVLSLSLNSFVLNGLAQKNKGRGREIKHHGLEVQCSPVSFKPSDVYITDSVGAGRLSISIE
ncbi:hypothetical protein BOTBODRAFT_432923 [Botryobasidium botryosum FD-172 SS1]|uniref:Uncharacterized protein n=1 Tax=Botryobasidium botryosum (strain FD-172 SS1) TaxID=930990 RepID=A0A067MWZ0_BOTB1|nr:hypothetical protein BOTBODRAFT_432923 [Botryobasidium botryosum FD-172 SS1]